MHFSLIVACKSFALNPNDNLLSIHEIVEELAITELPTIIPQICFVFMSRKTELEPKKFPIECEILNNGNVLRKTAQDLDYVKSNKNRYLVTTKNLQITEEGKLTINLYYNKRKNNVSLSIDVIKVPITTGAVSEN